MAVSLSHSNSIFHKKMNETNNLYSGLSDAECEQGVRPAFLGSLAIQTGSSPRIIVRIRRYATHLLDRDNLYGGCKALIDRLREAKLIPDDDEASIQLEVSQEKVSSKKAQGTLLEIEYP